MTGEGVQKPTLDEAAEYTVDGLDVKEMITEEDGG